MIKILNYRNNCELNYPLVVIFGKIKLECSKLKSTVRQDQFIRCKYQEIDHKCLITSKGRFKFIILMKSDLNVFEFTFENHTTELSLIYRRLDLRRWIKLYYVVCSSASSNSINRVLFDEGKFQSSKNNCPNTIENAKRRIGLALLMLQTFLASILPNRSTFDLVLGNDNYPTVELFHSNFSLEEFKKMSQEDIWRNIAVELLKANDSNPNLKYLAFLSFSRYNYDEKLVKDPNQIRYNEAIKMTECFIALGGGSLACLSTCSMFCWPESVDEIEFKFNDTTTIDTKLELNDCGDHLSRSSSYGDLYSNSFGAVFHELCHIFDLGHETYGVMDRQFGLIKNYFLDVPNEVKIQWFNRPSFLLLSNHKFLNKNLKCMSDDYSGIETICLAIEDVEDELSTKSDKKFIFDRMKSKLTSVNGIILIEYRCKKDSYTCDYIEFNLAKKVLNLSTNQYLKNYKNKQDTLIIVLDKLGNLFKFI